MQRPDVRALRAELGPDEFRRWYVAYHVLNLDGGHAAASIAAALHNEIGPLVAAKLGTPFRDYTASDCQPEVIFRDAAAEPPATSDDDETDELLRQAKAMWGMKS